MKRRNIAFLNAPGQVREAHIAWDVGGDDYGGFVVISDCSRKVSLDISMGERDHENSLYKLDRLIAELEKCRTAFYAERGRYVDSQEKKK